MSAALTTLTFVIPQTRSDNSALPLSQIASVTFNKAVGAGASAVLSTVPGAPASPLTSYTVTAIDSSPDAGQTDNYTATYTDIEGNVAPLAAASVSVPPSQLAPLSAGTLSATFTPAS